MKVTKQGVRDLNPRGFNGRGTKADRRPIATCAHVWEDERVRDCWTGEVYWIRRCGGCHEVRHG